MLFSGYRGRPDLTAAALDGGWFVTSDVGEVDASGRLTVRGRADGMINTGGEKVAADEVASVLEACPGVREAVVVGRPDPEWGEVVTAIVVPADPADPPGLDVLRGFARGRLPDYAAPRAVVVVPACPVAGFGQARPAGAEVAGAPGLGPGRTKGAPGSVVIARGGLRRSSWEHARASSRRNRRGTALSACGHGETAHWYWAGTFGSLRR